MAVLAEDAVTGSSARLPELTALEVASGMVFGSTPAPAAECPPQTPREALRGLLIPALARPPCLVAFSGGRDSSAMLAAATATARELGLPDPVPLTLRFAAHPRTHEAEWQEAIVRHLGLQEWVVRPLTDELDVVGPLAASLLHRHGLYWPPNAHTMALLLREASGGTLVTGNGGDEMLSPWGVRRIMEIRRGRRRPRLGELEHVALSLAPAAARRLAWRARRPVRLPWLTDEGGRQLARVVAARWAQQHRSWHGQLEHLLGARYLHLGTSAFRAFARDLDTVLVEPFLDARFVRAVAAALPREGPTNRTAALETVFGDLLPRATTRRPTKAVFTEVLWGPASRSFAAAWDGGGIDTTLLDPVALRAAWARQPPDLRCMTALQGAWLAGRGQD